MHWMTVYSSVNLQHFLDINTQNLRKAFYFLKIFLSILAIMLSIITLCIFQLCFIEGNTFSISTSSICNCSYLSDIIFISFLDVSLTPLKFLWICFSSVISPLTISSLLKKPYTFTFKKIVFENTWIILLKIRLKVNAVEIVELVKNYFLNY